jgi:Flp pilus assembly pilin Flp
MSTLLFHTGTAISWMRAAWLARLERAVLHMEGAPPRDNGNRTLMIVLIVLVGVPLLCVCVSIVVIAILTLLGPSIGNVFSGINDNLQP